MEAHPTASRNKVGRSGKQSQLRVAVNRTQLEAHPTQVAIKSAAVGSNPNCVSQSIGRSGFSHLTASRNKVGRSGKQSPMCVAGNRTQLETHPIASLDIQLMADGPPLSGGPGNSGVMGLYIGLIGASRLLLLMSHYQTFARWALLWSIYIMRGVVVRRWFICDYTLIMNGIRLQATASFICK